MKFIVRFCICSIVALTLIPTQGSAQIFGNKKKKEAEKTDTVQEPKKDKNAIKAFKEVVTEDALSDDGLIPVHKVNQDYYFEINKELMEKEILVVSRISGFVKGLNFGGAGVKSRPQQVVRFQLHDRKILLRSVSYNSVASPEDPIYRSVRNNNFEPIIAAFDLACYNADSTGYLIKVNSFFTSDIPLIGALTENQKKSFGVKGVDAKRSLINHIHSYPENVEVRHILTYTGSAKIPDNKLSSTLSVELNQSFIVLPESPMEPRLYDDRVGYFSITQTDYSSNAQKTDRRRFITRWRLEPSDMQAWKNGELVEPIKPIVYYIDPATPMEWRPYLKQGVNDWQKSFEKIGFKNAIYALDPPSAEEDPDWSPEDVRYSVIRYISTDIQNAQGPHVHDPRTGEILESDIMWYHNVMNLLRNWFFVQTAAYNSEAQSPEFNKEVMGELIRFVAAHEVGHTLGLPHNMGSSVAYPVDSLRSASFTCRMGGTAPSIMDYARFNYIAQPEDSITCIYPGIGPYDDWSIEYGYKPLPDAKGWKQEKESLHQMILAKAGDPLYRYGAQRFSPSDPSSQTEDLGDDAVKASSYGLLNLQRIVPNLTQWATEDGEDYETLRELYGQVLNQYGRYMRHVRTYIGGVYEYPKTSDETGPVFIPVEADKQREALAFLKEQLFETPHWMLDQDVLSRIEGEGALDRIAKLQNTTLKDLLSPKRLKRLVENEARQPQSAYPLTEFGNDLRSAIWGELQRNDTPDVYRRQLQSMHINALGQVVDIKQTSTLPSDVRAMARLSLTQLKEQLQNVKSEDLTLSSHVAESLAQIHAILEPHKP